MTQPLPLAFDPTSVMYKLGSIETDIKAIKEMLSKKESEQDKEITNLKTKVSKLESDRAYFLGGAAVVAFIVGLIQKVIPWANLI